MNFDKIKNVYAVSLVAFGNRDFDDALMELSLLMEQNNLMILTFCPIRRCLRIYIINQYDQCLS